MAHMKNCSRRKAFTGSSFRNADKPFPGRSQAMHKKEIADDGINT